MFEKAMGAVIGIDTDKEVIHFYTMAKGDRKTIDYYAGNYRAKAFDNDFYTKLSDVIRRYRESHPSSPIQKISLVLPDATFLTDSVNIPMLNKRAMDTSLMVTLSNLYGSNTDIKFNSQVSAQNKQFATYSVVGVRREILARLREVCAKNQLNIMNVTYASNAAVDGAFIINPKLRNSTFVLLDIKNDSARIVFVVKGKTMGFYSLPFGTSVLYKTRVVAEDLAFDHSPSELIVLNAKEKAKAKALTMSDDRVMTEAAEEDVPEVILETEERCEAAPAADAAEQGEDEDVEEREEVLGILFDEKRTARKLPKYMLRPTPTNKEGFIAENFRLFVKWTLDLIASNTAITSLGMPDTVYVNMPSQYNFVLGTVNQEFAENKVKFLPLTESELPQHVGQRLELFGGLYAKQYNKINNFHANQMDAIKAKSAYKGSIFGEKKSISFDDVVVKIKDAVSGLAKKKPEAADGTPPKDAAVTKRLKKEKDRTPKAEKQPKPAKPPKAEKPPKEK